MVVLEINLFTSCHALTRHNLWSITLLLHLPSFSSHCSLFSPPLGLLWHGATQGFGNFGELHEGRFERGEVSGDFDHSLLAGTDPVWSGEGLQVVLTVWGSTSKPYSQLCGGEDGQGEGHSLWQQLMLPDPSFHSANSEDPRGAGLHQWTGLPLPGHSLPTRVVVHFHRLSVGIREKFQLQTVSTVLTTDQQAASQVNHSQDVGTETHFLWLSDNTWQILGLRVSLPALTFPEDESWGWCFASQHCSSPSEPCSPPVRYSSVQLPQPHHYVSSGRYRLASWVLEEDLSQICCSLWVLLSSPKIWSSVWDADLWPRKRWCFG